LMPRARAPLATLSNAVQLYDDGPLFWIEFQLMSKRIQPACAALTASRYRERSVELRFWRLPPEENPKRLPAGGGGGGAGGARLGGGGCWGGGGGSEGAGVCGAVVVCDGGG